MRLKRRKFSGKSTLRIKCILRLKWNCGLSVVRLKRRKFYVKRHKSSKFRSTTIKPRYRARVYSEFGSRIRFGFDLANNSIRFGFDVNSKFLQYLWETHNSFTHVIYVCMYRIHFSGTLLPLAWHVSLLNISPYGLLKIY